MTAILRRELNAYFSSPLGYVFLAVFYFFAGFFFFGSVLYANSADVSPVFSSMFTILMFVSPILTMRLMSEEKRQKTDQALLTAPVSLTGIIYAKFFAAFLVFAAGVAITLVFAIVMAGFASPQWLVIFGNITGLLLLGGALISIGLFVSSLTENQLVAAVGSFAIMMLLMLMDSIASAIPIEAVSGFLNKIAFLTRYYPFTTGVFDLSNVLFFLSVIFIFNFLSVRVLEKKRWS